MKKHILILSRRDDRKGYDNAQNLTGELNDANSKTVEYSACFLEDLFFSFNGHDLTVRDMLNDKDLVFYDAVFMIGWFKDRKVEDLAISAGIYLNHHGKEVLNSEILKTRSRSKLSQLVHACLNGVQTAEFVAVNDINQLDKFIADTKLDFPLIVKSATGFRGKHNSLVSNMAELSSAVQSLSSKISIVQRYIPNDGDLRVIVMGGEVKLVFVRKSSDGSHLNNTSLGGKAEIVKLQDVDKSVLEQSIKISKLLGREITGIDMVQDKTTGQYYFLEVNIMPQLSTGSFVKEKILALNEFLEALGKRK